MEEFSFISAKDARERANQSEIAAQKWLKNIEPQIIKAADANEFRFTFHMDAVDVTFAARLPDLPPQIKHAIVILEHLGYGVNYCTYGERYVPRGLQDEAGEGPLYQNIGLVISW